jgi:hypothetical protein
VFPGTKVQVPCRVPTTCCSRSRSELAISISLRPGMRVIKQGPNLDTIPVICPVRNEAALLPHFLDHYRRIGVERFIFIDNGSVDGGQEYLCAQPDCRVYVTNESYRDSNFGTSWINKIIESEGIEGWLVYADVDEHLNFVDCESERLTSYCERLSRKGFDAAYAIMIDMYPADDFLDVKPCRNVPLVETMAWFDTDYVMRTWPMPAWEQSATSHPPQILGGPRCRLQTSLEREFARRWFHYMMFHQVDRFIDYIPQQFIPALARIWPVETPALHKTPLNYVRPGFRYWNSHAATNRSFSTELLAFLHFKFCSELQARFRMVHAEANHFRRGLHYVQLQQSLQRWQGSLIYHGSAKYESSQDLLRVDLIGNAASHVWMAGRKAVHRFGKAAKQPTGMEASMHRPMLL